MSGTIEPSNMFELIQEAMTKERLCVNPNSKGRQCKGWRWTGYDKCIYHLRQDAMAAHKGPITVGKLFKLYKRWIPDVKASNT